MSRPSRRATSNPEQSLPLSEAVCCQRLSSRSCAKIKNMAASCALFERVQGARADSEGTGAKDRPCKQWSGHLNDTKTW